MTISDFENTTSTSTADIDHVIARARDALLATQQPDGHFVFELEADATIPAEYILFVHFLGEPADPRLEQLLGAYLRRIQGAHGGWPLFHDGAFDMSASVKAYFALKMIGDSPDSPHMTRAREAILAHGGAARSNVFTRALLALYGEVPWRAVPVMPVEIMLLPKWFPFHLDKVSYWARTVLVPLLVITDAKPRARNSRNVHIPELFTVPAEQVRTWPRGAHQKKWLATLFGWLDRVLRLTSPHFPQGKHKAAVDSARRFVDERLNGEDGLGAIFPAMVNSVIMYELLGISPDDPRRAAARRSIDRLLVVKDHEAYCQPCVSPVWDTALASHALLEAGDDKSKQQAARALDWLVPRQVLDVKGDWSSLRPGVRPGGWAFQYANPHYPDLDDTAVVVMAMHRIREASGAFETQISRGSEWVTGLQSANGGWGAFDADNDTEYLNHIPFADHGALLDPPTADVSARCVSMLSQLGHDSKSSRALERGVAYLLAEQEVDGSWFGRWGMNYIYGTWSALCALNAAGLPSDDDPMRKAAVWLKAIQNEDGGWGEGGESYQLDYQGYVPAPSTASQTAWALLGLMAAGDAGSQAVERGIKYLAETMGEDGTWTEERFTATGFPRVFYLRYHGYAKYFPLWAVARYRNLMSSNSRRPSWGM